MLKQNEKDIIKKLAKKYSATQVILFGSAVDKKHYNDIDIGVSGIHPEKYFDFCGQLLYSLSKPVDVINLDKPSRFNSLVVKQGVRIA